ncbi:MAG: alpha-L-fucosidase [Rariglobus sp.]|jgi:alpha-L-fucosidase|nr:alpha-L-fucosidase [Rariglobus sp.]
MTWFNQARYGLFIHWGAYSVAGRGEWVANRELHSKEDYIRDCVVPFTAGRYDPREWARLAKDAGMGYAVLTTRHHDGFCLWDTDTTDFKATALGPKRDLVRDYVAAFRAAGLKVGLYYSVADWFHPDYPGAHRRDWPDRWPDEAARQRFVKFYHAQLEELMTRYGKIDLLWYDGCIPSPTDGTVINTRIKQLQPHILINDRNGDPHDFHSCEQAIKPAAPGHDWEACMTLNENWGYHAGDTNWKTPRQVVRMLLETSCSAGNLLLNVGPKPDGTIPEESVRILRESGDWLRRNREFLENSGRSPFTWNNWGRITTKGDRIYLHVINGTGPRLRVSDIANRVLRAFRLDGSAPVRFDQQGDLVTLHDLPASLPDPICTTFVLEVEGQPATTRAQTSFWIPG